MGKLGATFFFLLFAGTAAAQSSGNIFFGYSYYNTNLLGGRNGLNGWEGSLEGKVLPVIGIVGDVSGHYGSLSSELLYQWKAGLRTFRWKFLGARFSVRSACFVLGRKYPTLCGSTLRSGTHELRSGWFRNFICDRNRRWPSLQVRQNTGLAISGRLHTHEFVKQPSKQRPHFDWDCTAVLKSQENQGFRWLAASRRVLPVPREILNLRYQLLKNSSFLPNS